MANLVSEAFNSYTASDLMASLVTDVVSDIAFDAIGEQLSREAMPAADREDGADVEPIRMASYQSVAPDMNSSAFADLTAPGVVRSGSIIGRIEPAAGQNYLASAA